MAWTSTILTGVAVVSAGVGVALWFTSDGAADGDHADLELGVSGGPGSAMGRATWTF